MLTFTRNQDKKLQQLPELLKADEAKSPGPTNSTFSDSDDEIDWDLVSAWCQNFLGLPESELNSLWYERLAEAASSKNCKADTILSLYERAIKKENPSWLCHRGLGETHFNQGKIQEAIVHVETALKEAGREGATPRSEAKDIVELNLLLGRYAYNAGDAQKAAEYYLLACKSEDLALAKQGQLGYLKAGLSFPDPGVTRQLLKSALAKEGEGGTMVSILKMIARDAEHDVIVSKIFTVTREDQDLFRDIVRAMETATAMPAMSANRSTEIAEDDLFAEDEARGVLLYDRGVAAYTYEVSPDGTEAVSEALRLWRESRDLLSNVGGENAFMVRQDATTALAQHYFQSMIDGNYLDHVGALSRLAEAESNVYRSDAAGFLGTVYALHGKKEQAKTALLGRMRQALQILLDDTPENDAFGFSTIQQTLEQYQDFDNAAIALSLQGQPDLVTDALYFETKDIVGHDGVDEERLLATVTKLAEETVQVAKAQIPNASQQIQRIEAAKAHVDSLIAAAGTKPKPEANGDNSEAQESENSGQSASAVSDLETASAYTLLQSRLSNLQRTHSPQIDSFALQWWWTCDGRTPDGKHCDNIVNFEREFYHCMYCSNRDFCPSCFARLRTPDSGAGITACSAKHRWLRVPPHGSALYVGLKAKSVRMPREVRPMKDDESVFEILYDEDGGKDISLEAWKEKLATEWGISLEEIRKEISRQATPDAGGQGEE